MSKVTISRNDVSMLLAAISSAYTYNQKEREAALLDAGMIWVNAKDEDARAVAWEEVVLAAGWNKGPMQDEY